MSARNLIESKFDDQIEFVVKEEPRQLYLARFRVPEKLRGQGIGSNLMNSLKNRARLARKPILLQFSPDSGTEDAVAGFYAKHGFRFLPDRKTMIWKPAKKQ